MDAIITYVDGQDPLWLEDYRALLHEPVMAKRFRDWGTLRYLLRGIETHMPFVENVYLVVARESQIPSWASDALKVVLHRDIIPAEYLPTFNSTTIEMFLHRIPGLSERFLYFNDDMFPVMDCREDDFFVDGKCAMGFSRHLLVTGLYKQQTRNADRMARRALRMPSSYWFLRPQHTCSPMLRSASEEVFDLLEPEILRSLTPLREACNLNQYLFLDYLYHSGQAVSRRISNKHLSLASTTAGTLAGFLSCPTRKLVCINDVRLTEAQYKTYHAILQDAFPRHFPGKSRFEL
ncbi:MAG: hypothetical protein IJ721_10300 [Bacteroidales bacterium]|nr:hypothetical protein [Bacteroidales bacterium]